MNFVEGAFSVTLNAIGFANSTNTFGGLPDTLVMAKGNNYS